MRLDELQTQALRYLAIEKPQKALRVYRQILAQRPNDLDTRMRVGDVLSQLGARDWAVRVYAAVAHYDAAGGRPLHALVAMQALAELGHDIAQPRRELAELYAAGSPKIARVGARLSMPLPDESIEPPDLEHVGALADEATAAAQMASDLTVLSQFPAQLAPVPLLSELPAASFAALLDVAQVRRLAHGTLLVRAGEPGDALYLLAAGEVRIFITVGVGAQASVREIGRLHEGAIFGELALVHAHPRSVSAEVVGLADVIALPRQALLRVAAERPEVATVFDRFIRERLVKNLLATSSLFRPFNEEQRVGLVRRMTGHDVTTGTELIREGDDGTGLFLLLAGDAEVVRSTPAGEATIATLHAGDCFGEISLLRNQPAMATVRATTAATVLFLAREYFTRLVGALPQVRAFFEHLTEERLRDAQISLPPDGIADETGENILF